MINQGGVDRMRFDWRTVSSQRSVNLAGFLVCLLMMAYALYSQHVGGLNPCPLCVFQRFAVIGLGLNYILDAFPFTQALSMIFEGSGECAVVDWTFIGLSMPAWVLISLLFLGVAGTFNNFRPHTPLAIDCGRF